MGRIGVIKSGLYFAVRPGSTEEVMQVDPFLMAGKLANDSVLAFHTTLELLGFGFYLRNDDNEEEILRSFLRFLLP
jgi:hypothetical protein